MKVFFISVLLTSSACFAQSKTIIHISKQVSIERLKENLYYLASDMLEGRLMASHGDTLASIFVGRCFKKNHLTAPFNNGKSYFQSITAYKKKIVEDELFINGHSYLANDGWDDDRGSGDLKLDSLPVQYAGYANPDTLFQHLVIQNVKDKAVIVQATAIINSIRQNKGIETFLAKLKDQGVKLLLFYNAEFSNNADVKKSNDFLPEYINPFENITNAFDPPGIVLNEARINELLEADQKNIKELEESFNKNPQQGSFELKTKLSAIKKTRLDTVHAPNIIGIMKGTDTAAASIILCAHHDHDGRNGNEIYYGAVDNASGTVAIMEIARLMHDAVEKGLRPKRSIVFASFTGEERGLLGSIYYSNHPVCTVEKTYAVLNIDMVGRVDSFYSGKRPDSNYAYILVKDSLSRGLRNALYNANHSSVNLKLDTYYEQPQYAQRRITGSDQYPFYLKGIPFIRIDCGFTKDYHKPTDTADKINYELLAKQTQLAFLTLWNLANE